MSGPLTPTDLSVDDARTVELGGLTVRRLLPKRHRRTVGAWCFVDHFGPTPPDGGAAMEIGPHPHIGLHTVTWLLDGEVLHTDSLGSEQPIRPGQLNLMTAGHGIAHAEQSIRPRGGLHGAQLWVAQPSATRTGAPAFEHHEALPVVDLDGGHATVLLGAVAGTEAASPARTDTPIVGAAVQLDGSGAATALPLTPSFEHAVVVLDGLVEVAGRPLVAGQLAHLAPGADELGLRAGRAAHLLLLGGEPFDEELLMWWNFVARERGEIAAARDSWQGGDGRFGAVASPLASVEAPPL